MANTTTKTSTPRKVNIIGHLNPDTDSICSAIALAELKNALGPKVYEARRAGAINRETSFVLEHFNLSEPKLITSVRPQIKDVEYNKSPGVPGSMSLYEAWDTMHAGEQYTLCICSQNNELEGLITVKDIANANLAIFDSYILSHAQTPYANILDTLSADLIVGEVKKAVSEGRICVSVSQDTPHSGKHQGDVVIVANHEDTQMSAIEAGAQCVIICSGITPSDRVIEAARAAKCALISTPYDVYAAARLIGMSVPIRSIMLSAEKVIKFSVNSTVEEVRQVMSETRHRFFPIIDDNEHFCGIVTGSNLFNITRKHVILVDHNETSQAVDGLSHAIIDEIVDHHRLGNIETTYPVEFRNEPVGCTATIVKAMYDEHNIVPSAPIAGAMLSAILSDTLAFSSPTCTERDKQAAHALAKISGVDIATYADQMFEAGADVSGRTAQEVFHSDFKVFSRANYRFGVGQSSFMTENSRKSAEELIGPYLKDAAAEEGIPLVFYLFTDVKSSSSDILFYGSGAAGIIKSAFGVDTSSNMATLPGVVSRKKQVVPAIMEALEKIQE